MALGDSSVPVYNIQTGVIPTGGFYNEEALQIPYRTQPTNFLFQTSAAVGTVFTATVNNIYAGQFVANWQGWVIVSLLLPSGICNIVVENAQTGIYQTIDLANNKFLTWVGATTDSLNSISLQIQEIHAAISISTVTSDDIQNNFGNFVATPRVPTYTLEVYRQILIEVIQAFKYWSATPEGLANVIATFTQIRPSVRWIRQNWKRWLLGWQMLHNRTMTDRYRYVKSNSPSTGITATAVSGSNEIGTSSLKFTPPGSLQYQSVGDASYGTAVNISAGGTFTLFSGNGYDSITVSVVTGTFPAFTTIISCTVTGLPNPNYAIINDADFHIVNGALMQPLRAELVVTGLSPSLALQARPDLANHWGEDFVASFWISQSNGGSRQFVVEISLDGGVTWMMGTPTNITSGYRGVSSDPTSTAIVATAVSSSNSVGASLLLFTAPHSLQYKSVGDTSYGTAVNISAGGSFTLFSGNATDSITVTVILPLPTSTETISCSVFQYQQVSFEESLGRFDSETDLVYARVRCSNPTIGDVYYLEKAALTSPETGALYLGINTIPRWRRDEFFAYLIQLYVSEAIEYQAYQIMGINSPLGWGLDPWGGPIGWGSPSFGYFGTLLQGLCEYIVPTQVDLSFFQDTITMSGEVMNVFGTIYENDWRAGTSTNFVVVPQSPDRFSYIMPIAPTVFTATLTFDGSGNAILPDPAIQDPTQCVLLENGQSIPNTEWSFVSATEINMSLSDLNQSSVYMFTYPLLMTFETQVIDTGVNYALFNWKADWYSYRRCGLTEIESPTTQAVTFNQATLQATLNQQADTTASSNTLYVNTGSGVQPVSPTLWSFFNSDTIQINSSVFSPTAVYSISYTAQALVKDQVPVEVVQVATSTDGVSFSSFETIPHDAPFGNAYRYFKFFVTVSNVVDVRDYKLRSLTMKGDPLNKATIVSEL